MCYCILFLFHHSLSAFLLWKRLPHLFSSNVVDVSLEKHWFLYQKLNAFSLQVVVIQKVYKIDMAVAQIHLIVQLLTLNYLCKKFSVPLPLYPLFYGWEITFSSWLRSRKQSLLTHLSLQLTPGMLRKWLTHTHTFAGKTGLLKLNLCCRLPCFIKLNIRMF